MSIQQLISSKRDRFRSQIRRSHNETLFKAKRTQDYTGQLDCYSALHKELCDNLDRTAAKVIDQKELMKELVATQSKYALLIICNLCATDSSMSIYKLIFEHHIDQYLMQKLKQHSDSINHTAQTTLLGLSNLLFSERKYLEKVVIYLLENEIIQIIIKQRQLVDESDDKLTKEYLIRLTISILKLIKYYKLAHMISQQRLVDLFTMSMKWIEQQPDLCSVTIVLICDYVEHLLELVDKQTMHFIFQLSQISFDQNQYRTVQLLTSVVANLFKSGQPKLIIELLDSCEYDTLLSQILLSDKSSIICPVIDLFIYIVNLGDEELIQYCSLLQYSLIDCFESSQDPYVIVKAAQIIETIALDSEVMDLHNISQLFSDKAMNCYQIGDYITASELLIQLAQIINNHHISINYKQRQEIEHLTLSDNELIRQISTQLLTTTIDDMHSLSDYEY